MITGISIVTITLKLHFNKMINLFNNLLLHTNIG